jgi:hypothetical protein
MITLDSVSNTLSFVFTVVELQKTHETETHARLRRNDRIPENESYAKKLGKKVLRLMEGLVIQENRR